MSGAEANPAGHISQVVEHLFRHESGKMVATLTRIFGLDHLTLAEDVVQEALSRAMQTWPFYGLPQNPAAWIMRTARNLALDVVRREQTFRSKETQIIHLMEHQQSTAEMDAAPDSISDDRLRMMFVCCHPILNEETQVALALKTLCGFSVGEIARAFLVSEAAMAKRLVRARQDIREAGLAFEIPSGQELAGRVDGVLRALYFLFNEGYKASSGNKLIREDICAEAIRLAELLVRHPAGDVPPAHALLALMLMNAARLPARVDDSGNLLRLQEQDRKLWDKRLIARGMFHLARSGAGERLTSYHIQAAIAACHSTAQDYAATDWPRILELYDGWMRFDASPVIALNRAVALSKVRGPAAGLQTVRQISNLRSLDSYYLLYAVLGELEASLNHPRDAAVHFRRSLELAELASEQAFLAERLRVCEAQSN